MEESHRSPEDIIREAVGKCPYRIVTHIFGVSYNRKEARYEIENDACCPLGAVLLAAGEMRWSKFGLEGEKVARILGVSEGWIIDFTMGFDGDDSVPDELPEAYYLGRKLRGEYSK